MSKSQVKLINGPNHGELYESQHDLWDGDIIHTHHYPELKRCAEDTNLRGLYSLVKSDYKVDGDNAYYLKD